MNKRFCMDEQEADRRNWIFPYSFRILLVVVVSLAAVLFCSGTFYAETSGTCGDGLTWTLSDDGILQISGSGSLTGGSWDEKSIVQVSIPAGVTSVEEGLFINCSNMVSFNVSSSNSQLASENGVLFNKDKSVLIAFAPGKSGAYTIPGTVKTVKIGAFAYSNKLTSVTMSDSVTSLGKYAFNCCSGLKSVVISKGVKVIPQDCFSNCTALTSVTIPEGVTTIEASAFWGCSSLTSIALPKSLSGKSIAEDAFEGCSLDKASAETVGGKLDNGSESSEDALKVGEERSYQCKPTIKGSLIDGAFYGTSSDESVVEILTLTRNGSIVYADAVQYFYVLGVKGVGPGKAVVTVYADSSKSKVIGTTEITVTGDAAAAPAATKPVTTAAKKVRTVTVGGGIYKLSGSVAVLSKPKNKNITVLKIPATVSANGKKYKVTSVAANACKGLKKLKTVAVGKNVTAIKKNAFSGCTKLAKLTIGKNVKSIGVNAFRGCSRLKTITINTTKLTAKTIGKKAFAGTPVKATVKVPRKNKKNYTKWLVKSGISKKAVIK